MVAATTMWCVIHARHLLRDFSPSKQKIYDHTVFQVCTEDKQSGWLWSQQSSALVGLVQSNVLVPLTWLYAWPSHL